MRWAGEGDCIEDPIGGHQEDTDPLGRKSRCDRNDPVARVSGAATAQSVAPDLSHAHAKPGCGSSHTGRRLSLGQGTKITRKR